MVVPLNLYGQDLFGRSTEHAIVRHLNNAPGGDGGVDPDAQFRLGADDSPLGHFDRRHGICCGIAISWLIGLIGGRKEASSCNPEFTEYFKNVLRFQGAYLKDFKGNINALNTLDKVQPQGCKKIAQDKHLLPHKMEKSLPDRSVWAAYLAIYHHAVGIGYANYRYFIMEPNAGLFSYQNKGNFLKDLDALIETRRGRKKIVGPGNIIKAWFYGKG